jgi:rhomboid protease GluP
VTYELVLISVVIGAGYWGVFFVRRQPHGSATFGLMQLGAAALAGLGLLHRAVDAPWLGVAGAIGAGAGTCLLVLGPIVRVLARRMVAAERVGPALRLLDLAELLAPGSGIAEEKALVRAMTEIREGRIDPTVEALAAARERAPADARLAIDERIAMLYLAAYRWRDAITHAEACLLGAAPPGAGDGTASPGAAADGRAGEGSLRGALGIAPPVWVELVGAYGRVGDLDRAAQMLARLEDVCAGRPEAAPWIHRARVVFLALAGRIEAVRALVSPRQARHMSAAARSYWVAIAHEHAGDRTAAVAAYHKARSRSRGRPRVLIDRELAELPALAAPRAALAGAARDVVARIEAAPLPPPFRSSRPRPPRAAWLLTAVLLAVSATTALALGPTADSGVMTRAGALIRGLVDAGEWWRLIACVFLHAGLSHLIFNVAGLVVLGRFAEDLFGGVRTIAIFGVAGLAGSVASYLASPVGFSAGASGAVFGLLGAVFVEITRHRRHHRAAWTRGIWGGLAVVTVAQLGYDFLNPVIDQWAHGAGLAAGALLGLALSPHARWTRLAGHASRVIAIGFGVVVVAAGVLVVRTSVADSLAGTGRARVVVGDVAITAPVGWQVEGKQVRQPEHLVVVTLERQDPRGPAPKLATWIAAEGRRIKDELGAPAIASAPLIALPAGWEGTEVEVSQDDGTGYRQPVRIVLCGRVFGAALILTSVEVPESIARAAPGFFAQLLASIGPA